MERTRKSQSLIFFVRLLFSIFAAFRFCDRFNQPLGSWDVSRVTTMHWMFADTLKFNQPLESWNLSSIETMYHSEFRVAECYMYAHCNIAELIVHCWIFSLMYSPVPSLSHFPRTVFTHTAMNRVFCSPTWFAKMEIVIGSAAFYDSDGAMLCCEPGFYLHHQGRLHSCIACSPGQYQDESKYAQSRSCKECAIGYFSSQHQRNSSCDSCPYGYSQKLTGGTMCTA